MHDTHCHLGFMANAEEVAATAQENGTLLFANTVTIDEYETMRRQFVSFDNIRVGLGTHPWWADEAFDAERFEELATHERFIGEIGLDLGRRHEQNRRAQLDAFSTAACVCARLGEKVISLHAVHASTEVMETLRRTKALDTCTCIFHWFTGPSDVLKLAVQAGCLFSVGPRMLATGKGKEYVKAIPASQLLLETDAPPTKGQRYSYAELYAELETAANGIASIKGDEALEIIKANAQIILRKPASQ